MKKIISIALIIMATLTASAQELPCAQNRPVGWACADTPVTGSDDENPVTVTTLAELEAALGKDCKCAKKTIYIKGVIKISGQITIKDQANKTIYGLPGSAFENTVHSTERDESGILQLSHCKNIILRNITFKGAGAYDMDGKDNLLLYDCQNVWVDHCDFQDGVDGNMDINNGSDLISVTWCRFRYLKAPWPGGSGGSDDHRYSNLIGSSDNQAAKDEGRLRITYANCWWDEGCKERMPRIRFGQVHLLNCLFSSSTANYCIGAGYRCNAYVENCAFTSKKARKAAWRVYATGKGKTDYNITVTGCLGADDAQQRSGETDYFIPSRHYTYTAYDSQLVEQTVSHPQTGAGATLDINEGQPYKGI